MSSLRLFLLGTPRLERDGAPVELQYRKNVALIAYLAVTAERHTREALVTMLWPEQRPSRARANLRRDLSVLRKALGDEWWLVDRETVGLNRGGDLWLDVDQFRRLLSAWREHGHPEAEVCPQCLTALSEAVELYRGGFLAGFSLRDSLPFDEWQLYETEALRHQLGAALERLVRGHIAQGTQELALPYARRWLTLEPLHEPAHRCLMQLYAQTGQRVAALLQYQECARVLDAELGLSPSRETASLAEQIRAQSAESEVPPSPSPLPRHNLPAQLTPFIGREAELVQIGERLAEPACRLLTLVGPGGIGKTRLAVEAAREQVGRYKDGVYFVPLAALPSTDAVVPTVAEAVGLSFRRDLWRRLTDYLRPKHVLLVLDSLEHLLGAERPVGRTVVDLVNEILRIAPGVQILATSRARLNLQSESLLPIAGMEYPGPTPSISLPSAGLGPDSSSLGGEGARDPAHYGAVRLFLVTARRVRPGFGPTAGQLADVVRICRLVQGMPLAILLAAAWTEMLSTGEIAAELERGYDLLETSLRDLPDRQHSIRAVFDSSWRMLEEAEREVFARLSVLRGGFTRGAAEDVAGASLRTLLSLAHKSFLQRGPAGRYEIHELLRQYGGHRLAEGPEGGRVVLDLHCDYYAEILRQGAEDIKRRGEWEGLLVEMDNVRAGWRWAVSECRAAATVRYARGMAEVCCGGGGYQEMAAALDWAADVLRMHCAGGIQGEKGVALGTILVYQAHCHALTDSPAPVEERVRLLREGLSIVRRLGSRRQLVRCARAGAYVYGSEQSAEARQLLKEGIALGRELGDLESVSWFLSMLGEFAVRQGAYDEAERHCQEALDIGKENKSIELIGYSFTGLGKVAYHREEYQRAREFYEQALAAQLQMRRAWTAAFCSSYLGDTALAMGDYGAARDNHERARAMYEEMAIYWGEAWSGEHWGLAYSLDRLGDIALALGDTQEAWGYYGQALRIAREHPHLALALDVLACQAALLAWEGGGERATELAALAVHHPISDEEVKGRAQSVLAQMEAELPGAAYAAAHERGRARDPEAAVQELSAEQRG